MPRPSGRSERAGGNEEQRRAATVQRLAGAEAVIHAAADELTVGQAVAEAGAVTGRTAERLVGRDRPARVVDGAAARAVAALEARERLDAPAFACPASALRCCSRGSTSHVDGFVCPATHSRNGWKAKAQLGLLLEHPPRQSTAVQPDMASHAGPHATVGARHRRPSPVQWSTRPRCPSSAPRQASRPSPSRCSRRSRWPRRPQIPRSSQDDRPPHHRHTPRGRSARTTRERPGHSWRAS
jgi:hypothetical protein